MPQYSVSDWRAVPITGSGFDIDLSTNRIGLLSDLLGRRRVTHQTKEGQTETIRLRTHNYRSCSACRPNLGKPLGTDAASVPPRFIEGSF